MEVDAREVIKAYLPPPVATPLQQQAKRLESANVQLPTALYFAIEPELNGRFRYHLLNNTSWMYVFTLYSLKENMNVGLLNSKVEPAASEILFNVNLQNWDENKHLCFHLLHFQMNPNTILSPAIVQFRLKAAHFLKEPEVVPFLNSKAVLIDLINPNEKKTDESQTFVPTNNKELSSYEQLKQNLDNISSVAQVVDLHLDSLDVKLSISNLSESLDLQVKVFERSMSLCIAHAMKEIVFIHGLGSGKLRQVIHEMLKNDQHVKLYEIDSSGKYGQGATRVVFK